MTQTPPHRDLLATGPAPTLLPPDPAGEIAEDADLVNVVAAHPDSCLGWARLAELALDDHTAAGDVRAYAYARVGYHRGLDALRRSGWRGTGPVPWEHQPNRGFLQALHALGAASGRIGESDEAERCLQFLRDSSETAYQELVEAG